VTEDHKLQLSFVVDTVVPAFLRVNTCVTEKMDNNNCPTM